MSVSRRKALIKRVIHLIDYFITIMRLTGPKARHCRVIIEIKMQSRTRKNKINLFIRFFFDI